MKAKMGVEEAQPTHHQELDPTGEVLQLAK